MIRHGASLLRAFAAARVPKVTVILRKAYGGAVITMNSRDLGADLVFAWPQAEIGIMAARQAVGIVHRRRARRRRSPRHGARRARGRIRGRAPDRGPSGGRRVRRRGDRSAGDARAARLGARDAGAAMSEDPFVTIAKALREHRPSSPRAACRCYVALGDSFTAGTGCSRGPRLAATASPTGCGGERGLRLPEPRGGRGDQRGRARRSSARRSQLEPDLVTVVCGANDVLRSTRPDPSIYSRRLSAIFERLHQAGPRLIVVTATSPAAMGLRPARAAHARPRRGRHARHQRCDQRRSPPSTACRASTSPTTRPRATARTSPPTACIRRSAGMRERRARSPSLLRDGYGIPIANMEGDEP